MNERSCLNRPWRCLQAEEGASVTTYEESPIPVDPSEMDSASATASWKLPSSTPRPFSLKRCPKDGCYSVGESKRFRASTEIAAVHLTSERKATRPSFLTSFCTSEDEPKAKAGLDSNDDTSIAQNSENAERRWARKNQSTKPLSRAEIGELSASSYSSAESIPDDTASASPTDSHESFDQAYSTRRPTSGGKLLIGRRLCKQAR